MTPVDCRGKELEAVFSGEINYELGLSFTRAANKRNINDVFVGFAFRATVIFSLVTGSIRYKQS